MIGTIPLTRTMLRAFCALLLVLPMALPAQPGATRTSPPANAADIFIVPLAQSGGTLRVGAPLNVTNRDGYDNQPSFATDSLAVYFTSNRGDGQTDIYRYNLVTGLTRPVRRTAESEYSATVFSGAGLAVVRVEADSTQRLWRLPIGDGEPSLLFPDVKPVGYFAQADDSTWALFVLGSGGAAATLHIAHTGRTGTDVVARNIGRSLHRIPGTNRVSYVQKGDSIWYVMSYNTGTRRADTLVRTVGGPAEDVAWVDSTTLLATRGARLYAWKRGSSGWNEVADFSYAALDNMTRLRVSSNGAWLALVAEPQKRAVVVPTRPYPDDKIEAASVKRGLDILAGDAMEGRGTGTPGAARAAQWIAGQFKSAGLAPAGDSGTYVQNIPIMLLTQVFTTAAGVTTSRVRPSRVASWAAWDTIPAGSRGRTANVAGMIRGSDATLGEEVVLVTAHYDHLGIGAAVNGDSIFNGADDDASGVISLIEMAKALRNGPRPKRTIIFVAITGEEIGGIGTGWYLAHPIRPLASTVVDLNMEMIARPDSLAGGFGKAWLTGYERSTMGDLLSANAMSLVPDPRPGQNFFGRSDNIGFARAGIPAHTISSFNLHTDYHRVSDDPSKADAAHMAAVISASTRALRFLADGPRPAWHPGGQPLPPAPRAPRGP